MLQTDPFFSNFLTCDHDRSTIHEDIDQKNKNLLVTIGDSWTWGDSLFGINPTTKSDSPERLTAIYGYHLKNLLSNFDWINIAYPGTANRWIVDSAARIAELETDYEHTIISVGLTDIGRDLVYNDLPFDEVTAINCEGKYFDQLSSACDNRQDMTLLVGRNFTDTFDENIYKVKHHLPKRWVDISNEQSNLNFKFDGKVHYLTYPNSNAKISTDTKVWMLSSVFPKAENMVTFLDQCPLHYKIASKHPTEECHIFWANYLYNYIIDKQCLKSYNK